MTYRTKDYMLSENFIFRINIHDSIEIPKYSFVLPVDARWVPKHVKEELAKPTKDEIYVYTKFGFVVVPEKIVRLAL